VNDLPPLEETLQPVECKKFLCTAHIERWNNTLQKQLARFVRKTLSFSKCIKMHEICLKLFTRRYNTELLLIVG